MPETSRDVFFGKQANFQSDTNTGNDGHSRSIADDATTICTNRKRKQKTTNAGRQEELLLPFSSHRVSIKNTQETETVHNQNKTKSPSYQKHEDEMQKKEEEEEEEMFTTECFSTKIEIKMGPAACCCCCA
jgi:O-methyltransferase involved in polyketide biosynthesis